MLSGACRQRGTGPAGWGAPGMGGQCADVPCGIPQSRCLFLLRLRHAHSRPRDVPGRATRCRAKQLSWDLEDSSSGRRTGGQPPGTPSGPPASRHASSGSPAWKESCLAQMRGLPEMRNAFDTGMWEADKLASAHLVCAYLDGGACNGASGHAAGVATLLARNLGLLVLHIPQLNVEPCSREQAFTALHEW